MEPDPKTIKFPVWDQEIDEIYEMTMDEEDYEAMVEYEKQMEFEEYERRQRSRNNDY